MLAGLSAKPPARGLCLAHEPLLFMRKKRQDHHTKPDGGKRPAGMHSGLTITYTHTHTNTHTQASRSWPKLQCSKRDYNFVSLSFFLSPLSVPRKPCHFPVNSNNCGFIDNRFEGTHNDQLVNSADHRTSHPGGPPGTPGTKTDPVQLSSGEMVMMILSALKSRNDKKE